MAEITKLLFWRHLRSEPSSHILFFKSGEPVRSGRGLAFWFLPLSASVVELPMDDQELSILFHGRSLDFQDVTIQAVLTWRARDTETLAKRVNFSLDLETGRWLKNPLENMTQLLTELAQQLAWEFLTQTSLQEILVVGVEQLRERIGAGLLSDSSLAEMGIDIVSLRISAIRPTADVERALQMPTREAIQQEADKATFERRALAVERERAIAENELKNRIELAKRQEQLIEQEGQNERRRMAESAEAMKIETQAECDRRHLESLSEAESIRMVSDARMDSERSRVELYKELSTRVLIGLTAREFVGQLPDIDHLSISPELLGPILTRLAEAGTKHLEKGS